MLAKLVQLCHNRYSKSKCFSCSYQEHCPRDCSLCLHYIHSPQYAPAPRKYDCGRMSDFYVCKYAHKYTSEMYRALRACNRLRKKDKLNVLSIGCGPCTDLLALDLLKSNEEFVFSKLEYKGIELDPSIWANVHQDLGSLLPAEYSVEVIQADACSYISELSSWFWTPDVIIFQYVFSDMSKHSGDTAIRSMIKELELYIKKCAPSTYVICNDINLDVSRGGGRDYFDMLLAQVSEHVDYKKRHFNNSNRPTHYNYGTEYPRNDLLISIPDNLSRYNPFTSCASAQLLMMKVKK